MFGLVAQLILIIILNFKNQGHLNVLANLNYIKPEPCNRLVSPAWLGSVPEHCPLPKRKILRYTSTNTLLLCISIYL